MQPKYTLIRNATVLSMDPNIGNPADYDILIANDKIEAVGPSLALPTNSATLIDAKDTIITPGFVDGHHHVWQHLLRGIATDWTLLDYCVEMRTLYGSLFTPDDVHVAQYAGALSLLSNGVTCVLDHCHVVNSPAHADAAVAGLRDAGIRGTFCYGEYENPVLPGQQEQAGEFGLGMRREDARRVHAELLAEDRPEKALLTFGFAPREPEAQGIEDTVEDVRVGRELGARITTMHVGLGQYDLQRKRVVRGLAEQGLLGPDLVFSHGASFAEDELVSIAGSRAGVVGTPDTELQMGMGHPVVFRARDEGCRVGLGLDITSNQGNDFVAQMRLALQAQRAVENQGLSPPVTLARKTEEVLRMGTMGGAEVMQLESIVGSITPGKKADLVLFKCDDIDTVPVLDPVGTVVFHTSPANIDTVFVDGKIVKREGRLVGVYWETLRQQVEASSRRIMAEAAKVDTSVQREQWSRAFGI
ncbi:Metallo-dependent hydrolase [Aspergillus steynii IBT 23096]|uniref:Metallo-dependent hydrolase n=1 Tax=Aspergillus steynii IBT 23096 TaxID=1392250 RepID=A0A2I2G7U3_9EURO|nr:Metallo-dependent hydrolase [Aspergillus steynii IBT 23096]PLB48949.1 Metallo-dependent hydrolase [Aspergillus steynii IBT 23096]